MTEPYPTYSSLRLADQRTLVGVGVSAAAVCYLWQRQGLTTRFVGIGSPMKNHVKRKDCPSRRYPPESLWTSCQSPMRAHRHTRRWD
ncbi:MAG: hypothetical protein ACE5JU_25440, partial [Candidatus Binatia bacterium]